MYVHLILLRKQKYWHIDKRCGYAVSTRTCNDTNLCIGESVYIFVFIPAEPILMIVWERIGVDTTCNERSGEDDQGCYWNMY